MLCCRSPCTNDLVSSYPRLSYSLDNRGRKVSDNYHIHPAVISGYLTNVLWFDRLLPHIKGNVGFVFTKEDLAEVRDLLLANKVTIKVTRITAKVIGLILSSLFWNWHRILSTSLQVRLQCSPCSAVLSFPLQKVTCFLAIPVKSTSLDWQGRKVSDK